MTSPAVDVLILGGGPAGLSTALGLCRQLRSTVVFDAGLYRNAPASHMHNFLTWDHKSPATFREEARKNMTERYDTIRFEQKKIMEIRRTERGLFKAVDEEGVEWLGRKVVLAQGVRDCFPEIDGYGKVWGKAVFHCLFCHGFEERGGASAGVLADGMMSATHMALHGVRMAANLAKRIVVYTNGDQTVSASMTKFFRPRGIIVESRKIVSLDYVPDSEERLRIRFEDGEERREAFMLHHPTTEINGPFVEQLGLEVNSDTGVVKTATPFYETTVKGVFAVGDIATPMKAASQASTMGSFAASGLVAQLESLRPGLED